MSEDEIQELATRIANQIELKMRREGTWPDNGLHLTWPVHAFDLDGRLVV